MPEKAGAPPYQLKQFKYNSHYWILRFIEEVRRPLRILDVGTADGYLGAVLKQRGHYLVGVERDELMAQRARGYYDGFHLADVESFEFPYREEFDVVLFADVLEHLRDPAAVLSRALPCLKKTGEVIISVPNVANFIIRAGLLLGRFEYSERGILDRTHLRFFTLASLHRMLRDCGCAVLRTRATPVPVQLVAAATDRRLFAPLHELHYALVRGWKSLLAYQFVIRAAPKWHLHSS